MNQRKPVTTKNISWVQFNPAARLIAIKIHLFISKCICVNCVCVCVHECVCVCVCTCVCVCVRIHTHVCVCLPILLPSLCLCAASVIVKCCAFPQVQWHAFSPLLATRTILHPIPQPHAMWACRGISGNGFEHDIFYIMNRKPTVGPNT